ncbi:MAG: TIGR02453 family protein [Pseudomonadota bacterium]
MTKLDKAGFDLLEELAANNTRDWYSEHKAKFQSEVLDPFAGILEAVTARLTAAEMDFRGGKKTMFRMNRDVRFSKDKSPYKTNVSGMLTPSGDKAETNGFVYIQVSAEGGFAAFGRYKLRPAALGPIRDRILEETSTFEGIMAALKASGLDLVRDDKLKSMPRGYSDHDEHPFADELKLKNMMVRIDLDLADFRSGGVVDRVADTALKCKRFIRFVSV